MEFIKFLKRSGIELLLESLTPSQAAGIFKQYGATFSRKNKSCS
jgi:hypothetical protein